MARERVSTTVDADLLAEVRALPGSGNDASILEAALTLLLRRHHEEQIEASYAAYDVHPVDEPDEWGDLASFREAAGAS